MGITYFNWNELLVYSRKDLVAIICLLYGQTSVYNEINSKTLRKRIKANRIPHELFYSGLFRQTKNGLECRYHTKEPQSYIRNCDFLFYSVPIIDKIVYIRALSMRKLTDSVDYIPRRYYRKVNSNFFLNITEDKIYFPYESSQER